jgi:cobalt/nickel transport system permease protein
MSLTPEHLAPPDSPIARFDPRWKLAALLPAIGATAFVRSLPVVAVAFAGSLLLAWLARLPRRWLAGRLLVLAVALLPFLLVLPFVVDRGGPAWEWQGLRVSTAGVTAAAVLALKTLAVVTLALVVLGTAPLNVTLLAARRLRVPGLFVQLTLISYRYAFLLVEEFHRLRVALRVRGFRNRMDRHSYRTVGQVTGTLLVRGAERAERVAQAMRCRGFDGRFRALAEFRTTARDVLLFLIVVAAAAGLVGWDLWA